MARGSSDFRQNNMPTVTAATTAIPTTVKSAPFLPKFTKTPFCTKLTRSRKPSSAWCRDRCHSARRVHVREFRFVRWTAAGHAARVMTTMREPRKLGSRTAYGCGRRETGGPHLREARPERLRPRPLLSRAIRGYLRSAWNPYVHLAAVRPQRSPPAARPPRRPFARLRSEVYKRRDTLNRRINRQVARWLCEPTSSPSPTRLHLAAIPMWLRPEPPPGEPQPDPRPQEPNHQRRLPGLTDGPGLPLSTRAVSRYGPAVVAVSKPR